MKFSIRPPFHAVWASYKRISAREQKALCALALALVAALYYLVLWQPAKTRLVAAERAYQQQLKIADEVNRAQPSAALPNHAQPLSVRLSEMAAADGLDMQQMEVQDSTLRLTLAGDAQLLLTWIHKTEQAGAVLLSLTLDKRDKKLEAQIVVQASSEE